MTLVEERPPAHAPTRFTRWAWIAIALVPVGLVVGSVVSMMGEGQGHGVGGAVGGALIGLLCLAAPTLAVIFAGAALAAHERAGRPALAVSIPLLTATVVLLPVIAIGAVAWLIALAVTAAVVGGCFALRYCRQFGVNPMPTTVEKRREATPTHRVRSARWAWVSIAFSPLGVILAIVVMFGTANLVGVDLWSTEPLTAAESAEIIGPTMMVGFACPALGVVFGVRSARSGNRSGLVATIVAAAILLPLATWWLLTAIQV